mmetsp:Transcript_25030/g.31312  ORF Transcript_25030/g.31312 Transcript_25030/m.31312 type:complete len:140 (+) Transcript_25030:579-998(+)
MQTKARNNRVTVDQKTLDDFEKAYAENCDQDAMRYKHRNVGPSSPFHPKNVPPEQYRIPEKITGSPNKIDHRGFDANTIKYSGRVSSLGYKLLADHRKAAQVTALDWNEENFKGHKVADTTRKISLENFEKTGGADYSQ